MAEDVSYVSVSHFTIDALNILSRLNTKRLIPSDGPNKLPRDWRGLANLTGITAQDAENHHQNMVRWILGTWFRNGEQEATVHLLFRHLETLDRYDIRDDLLDLATANRLVNRDQRWTVETQLVAQRLDSRTDASELLTMDDVDEGAPVEYDALVLFAEADQEFVDVMIGHMTKIGFRVYQRWTVESQLVPQRLDSRTDASELLTMDDVDEGAPVEYDALVLFAEADQEFVDVMIGHMTKIGFRLFTKHSLRPGIMPYRPMTELINSRCRHTILVYSPAFFESLDDKFYTDYVHARNIVTKNHMLIPCVYKECELPTQYKYYFSLYVNSTAYNFWDRLARVVDSGRTPRLTTPTSTSSVRIQEVNSGPLQITNGHAPWPAGHAPRPAGPALPAGPAPRGPSPCASAHTVSTNIQSSTQTVALPDVPSASLSLSMTTLTSIESRRTDTTSLNDISVTKKKKTFSFLKKPFGWAKKKSKKPLLATN